MKLSRARSNFVKLSSFFFSYSPWMVIVSIIAGVIAGASGAALMTLINAKLANPTNHSTNALLVFISVALLVMLSTVVSSILSNRLAQRSNFDLRMNICRSLLNASLRQIEIAGDGRVLTTLTQDVHAIVTAFMRVPFLCINVAIIAVCLIYLGSLSINMLIALVSFVIFAIVSYVLPQRKANRYMVMAREEQANLLGHFRALNQGAKELKLHNRRREAFFSKVIQPSAELLKKYNLESGNIYVLLEGWGRVLYFVAIGLVLYALPMMLGDINAQTLTGYALMVLYMSSPVQAIVNSVPIFINAGISLNKIENLGLTLSASGNERFLLLPVDEPQNWRELELVEVTHAYYREREEGNFTLGPLNLTIRAGELLFLVGGNGSGKSTFAKLLSGLYKPDTGEIHIDGHEVTDENREYYRQLFTVVFTEFHVFEQLLGLDSPNLDSKAAKYLEELQLDQKVHVSDGKLSTTDLSHGQRKRLALLTAYLEDRPVYIFDEWAADQDPQFKEVFYHRILPDLKARGKTVVVISHDDRFYHVADRIIKLDYGKIVEDSVVSSIPEFEESYAGVLVGAKLAPAIPAKPNGNSQVGPLFSFAEFEAAQKARAVIPETTLEASPQRPYIFSIACFLIACAMVFFIGMQRPPAPLSETVSATEFSSARAMKHLEIIAAQPHPVGSSGHAEVRQYLVKVLNDAGLQTEVQEYRAIRQGQRATTAAKLNNVVARLEGTDPQSKSIMLTAHYDSVPNSPGASDDGAGVATLLETLRALKAGPPLRHGVIFLFTDGEEMGLLGAKGFMDEHPWARNVGLVLNFEARGTGGPVFMFETSDQNGSLITEFAKTAPYPFASSLMYTIYKLLPNDTDLTVFRRGGIPGFNFAFVGGSNRYHTQRDNLSQLDQGSLQHSGSYALALTRHFATSSSELPRARDVIYFDVLGAVLITYSQSWVIPMLVVLTALWALIVFTGLRRAKLNWRGLALGLAAFCSSVIACAGGATLLWLGLAMMGGNINSRTNAWLFFISLTAISFALTATFYFLFRKVATLENLFIGTLFGWLVITAGISLYLPGTSFLFIWPLFFSLLGAGLPFVIRKLDIDSWLLALLFGVCSLPGLLFLTVATHQVFQGFGMVMPGVLMLLVVLLLALLTPFFRYIPSRYKWAIPGAAVMIGLVFFAIAYVKPVYNSDSPRSNQVTYNLDADTGQASWISGDRQIDEWTSQFFTTEALAQSLASEQPSSRRRAMKVSAPYVALDAPQLSVRSDHSQGDTRILRVHITPRANTRILDLAIDGTPLSSVTLEGKPLEPPKAPANPPRWDFSYVGVPREGFELEIATKSGAPLKLLTSSTADGFPAIPGLSVRPRPDNLIPSQNSDTTIVLKSFDLGPR